VVGVGGLVAMSMLTLLVGRSTTDTQSSTTVIAAPGKTTTRIAPSAAVGVQAPPWAGQGWLGSNWYNAHKGQ
jgi:cobalamin synthase